MQRGTPVLWPSPRQLSKNLDAVLVASKVSRLVYDCNRRHQPRLTRCLPRSELIDVPGNMDLAQSERDARVETFYRPFQSALSRTMLQIANPIIVTVHSFTPIYHGQERSVEIGILHDSDTRLADAMLQTALRPTAYCSAQRALRARARRDHTLQEHAIGGGHLNVMLEIRNDLIQIRAQQDAMAVLIADWIAMHSRIEVRGGAMSGLMRAISGR